MLMIDDRTCNWALRVILLGGPSLEGILNIVLEQKLLYYTSYDSHCIYSKANSLRAKDSIQAA